MRLISAGKVHDDAYRKSKIADKASASSALDKTALTQWESKGSRSRWRQSTGRQHERNFPGYLNQIRVYTPSDIVSKVVMSVLVCRQLVLKPVWKSLIMLFLISLSLFVLSNNSIVPLKNHWRLKLAIKQYYKGFGKGFVLLFFVELCSTGVLLSFKCDDNSKNIMTYSGSINSMFKELFSCSPLKGMVFALFSSFFVAGFLEESAKLFMSVVTCSKILLRSRELGDQRHLNLLVLNIITFSLGFATAESCLYLDIVSATLYDSCMLLLQRVMFALPMHTICACITAKRYRYYCFDASSLRILWPSVALHGLYDFQALIIAALETHGYIGEFGGKLFPVTCSTCLIFFSWLVCERTKTRRVGKIDNLPVVV